MVEEKSLLIHRKIIYLNQYLPTRSLSRLYLQEWKINISARSTDQAEYSIPENFRYEQRISSVS